MHAFEGLWIYAFGIPHLIRVDSGSALALAAPLDNFSPKRSFTPAFDCRNSTYPAALLVGAGCVPR